MAKPLANAFQEYEFESDTELRTSKLLTFENLCMIRNLIAAEARARLNMVFDPLNPLAFAQEEAEHKGAISALQTLINEHEDLVAELNSERQSTSSSRN